MNCTPFALPLFCLGASGENDAKGAERTGEGLRPVAHAADELAVQRRQTRPIGTPESQLIGPPRSPATWRHSPSESTSDLLTRGRNGGTRYSRCAMGEPITNWAGNVVFAAGTLERPSSLDELAELVARSGPIHVVGSGHSFNAIADSAGVRVSLERLPSVVELDATGQRATVSAGMRLGELADRLEVHGAALANLASLPHISLGGACATGTHGSGDDIPNLSALVAGIEMVDAEGEIVRIDRHSAGEELLGSVISLGALGIVTSVTLELVPSYRLRQLVYDDLDYDVALAHLDELFASAYSVSLFVDWHRPHVDQIWQKELAATPGAAPPGELLGARLADVPHHPIRGLSADHCTEQLGVPGPWHERLPHFRAEMIPSTGAELQSEYLLEREVAVEALGRLATMHGQLAPLVQITELRSIAADELWLSPSFRRDSVGIHFTWAYDLAAVTNLLPAVEAVLIPLGARPHWGKLFGVEPDLVREEYEHLPDFQRLMLARDPGHKFANAFTDRFLAPSQ
jgi:alditol oxidase